MTPNKSLSGRKDQSREESVEAIPAPKANNRPTVNNYGKRTPSATRKN